MSIRPDYFSLDTLLQKKLFRIPEYQRAYSWESRQRNDLFSDIGKLVHSDSTRHHFMATIVCLKTNKTEEIGADEFGVYHIVDGQQRVTTLIILLKAIAKELAKVSDQKVEKREYNRLVELLVKDDRRLILLQTNHDSSSTFKKYLQSGYIPELNTVATLAERNLVKAFQECEAFVAKWQGTLLSLLKIVKNRLDFIFYVLEDEGSVYTIFEVLNSRGLPVDPLDKCKSMLMGIAFEKIVDATDLRDEVVDNLHKIWSEIYRTIGLKAVPGSEILRFAATLRESTQQSKVMSNDAALKLFRTVCSTEPLDVTDVSEHLLEVAKHLKHLYSNSRLKAVTAIGHARLLAVAIMLKTNLISSQRDTLLEIWEKVTFRIFGLSRKDARTKVGEYTRLAQRIAQTDLTYSDIAREIKSLGRDYPIEEAISNLKEANCYHGWEDKLLYFFFRYEEDLAKKQGAAISSEVWEQVWHSSPSKTIEHIHPQTHDDIWRGKFAVRRDHAEKHIHRLGNLMLLPPGVNSKAGKKSFVEKKTIYCQNTQLRLINEVASLSDWTKDEMEEREKRLIEWAKKTWA